MLPKYISFGTIAVLLILRFVALDNDPPLFYTGHSQSQITDPYHITYSARNAVLFDDWNPHGIHRWDVFKYSIVSAVSYPLFSLFGVSRVTANLSAIFLQLFGLLLFILGLIKLRPNGEVIVAALLLLLNSTLFFFGRIPLLENGLIFFSGLLFFVFVRYHDRIWGQVLLGTIVAFAVLSGKLFGFLLLIPVVLTMFYRYRFKLFSPYLYVGLGLVAGITFQTVIFYGGDVSIMLNYYTEQTVGIHGKPPGFLSIADFFKMLLSYGAESKLWRFTPFLLAMSILSLVLTTLTFPKQFTFQKEFIPICFCITWLIAVMVGLMPFEYRPMRYSIFMFIPLVALCAYMIWYSIFQNVLPKLSSKAIKLPMIFFFVWYGLVQYAALTTSSKNLIEFVAVLIPLAALLSLLITTLLYLWLRLRTRRVSRSAIIAIIGVLCLGHTVRQGTFIFEGLTASGENLKLNNAELAILVSPNSTITGPYMPAFTIDNKLDGIIYMFGLSNKERNLFEQFPITHVLTDGPNWIQALKDFPNLRNSTKIVQTMARDRTIDLYRLSWAKNQLTDFERASMFFAQGRPDSAQVYLRLFNNDNPNSMFGMMHLSIAMIENRKILDAVSWLEKLILEHPDNYGAHRFCDEMYSRIYGLTNDLQYQDKAKFHEARTIELNPNTPQKNRQNN